MTRRLLLWLLPVAACAQSALDTLRAPTDKNKKKFYITGHGRSVPGNKNGDCGGMSPIVSYGTDRINALLHCCSNGGLTVWTEEEWLEFRRKYGAEFDKSCEAAKQKPLP